MSEICEEPVLQQYLEALFGSMRDGVLIHADGAVVYANARIAEYLGVDPAELKGRCILELYSDEDYAEAIARIQAVAFGARDLPLRKHRLRRAGGIEFEVAAMPIEIGEETLVIDVLRRLPVA